MLPFTGCLECHISMHLLDPELLMNLFRLGNQDVEKSSTRLYAKDSKNVPLGLHERLLITDLLGIAGSYVSARQRESKRIYV